MQATVARAAVVGLTILGLSGCQSGTGGWSWPQWGSNRSAQQQYPNTAEGLSSAASLPNQAAAPNVQLPSASATPYSATPYGAAAQGAASNQQAGRQPQAYGGYPEAATSYSGGAANGGYPSTSAGTTAGKASTGYAEARGGYANPAASAYGSYPSAPPSAASMAPQEGYYGTGTGGSAAAATQTPNYGNYSMPSSPAEAAGGYPSASASAAAPYASTAPAASSYVAPESSAPAAPADYASSGALRTADNRSATGSRYDGGAIGSNSAYPSGSYPTAGTAEQPERYSKYGNSAPAASDASVNPSRYPATGSADNGMGSAYPATAPATSYPAQSIPSGGVGSGGASGTTGDPRYRPGGTKDYLPPAGSTQGSAIPGGYGSSSAIIRPAHYESTAVESAAAAAQIPASADRYSNAPREDGYGGMPSVVTPPEVSVPTVGR